MTTEQFAYWLQGFLELSGEGIALTPAQLKMVREHLATVFAKVTPPLAALRPGPAAPSRGIDWTLLPSTTCGGTSAGAGAVSFC